MLDINTPKGQETLTEELQAVALFTARYPQVSYVHTPKRGAATIDALLIKTGQLCGIVETKCRRMTRGQLRSFGNEWLVTWDKIDGARRIAAGVGVPLFGFLYLVPDRTLLVVTIADSNGSLVSSVRVEATQTQRTVNGGLAIRNNAFIDTQSAKVITAN
jgi:hypothetical protein